MELRHAAIATEDPGHRAVRDCDITSLVGRHGTHESTAARAHVSINADGVVSACCLLLLRVRCGGPAFEVIWIRGAAGKGRLVIGTSVAELVPSRVSAVTHVAWRHSLDSLLGLAPEAAFGERGIGAVGGDATAFTVRVEGPASRGAGVLYKRRVRMISGRRLPLVEWHDRRGPATIGILAPTVGP
jgi:hypothetical protein